MHRTTLGLNNGSSNLSTTTYSYDSLSRLEKVSDATTATNYSATYSYVANSPLVSQTTFKQGNTVKMTTTKSWDSLNRLASISSSSPSAAVASFSYEYNTANQRTRCGTADGSFWIYKYDSLGQVISGKKYWPDWTPVAGQQFTYVYDDIGNRVSSGSGGDDNGGNPRSATYGPNNLNQYTNRTVPNAFDVVGAELATNSVSVNGMSACPHSEYFRKEVSTNNSSVPVWSAVDVTAPTETAVHGNVFVPILRAGMHLLIAVALYGCAGPGCKETRKNAVPGGPENIPLLAVVLRQAEVGGAERLCRVDLSEKEFQTLQTELARHGAHVKCRRLEQQALTEGEQAVYLDDTRVASNLAEARVTFSTPHSFASFRYRFEKRRGEWRITSTEFIYAS